MHIFLRIIATVAGIVVVLAVWRAAILSLVVPRPARRLLLYRGWIALVRAPINAVARRVSYERRDRILAPVASLVMISLVPFWLLVFGIGYALMFMGFGNLRLWAAMRESGSSLFTLGFSVPAGAPATTVTFVAAITGPLLIALLIGYLPTLYAAFNRRETEVSLLAGRGGNLIWGPEILLRYQWSGLIYELDALYSGWERWTADIAETHTSYPALIYFRSPEPRRSWITSMIAVMDAAAIQLARAPSTAPGTARLAITGGASAAAAICAALGLPVARDPLPTDPIAISLEEWQEAWDLLDRIGFASEVDSETAYRHFRGWRVNWEANAYRLARIVQAPPLKWTGPRDRPLPEIARPKPRNRTPDDPEGLTMTRSKRQVDDPTSAASQPLLRPDEQVEDYPASAMTDQQELS